MLYICPHALQKPNQSVCAFGLTSWGFMRKLTAPKGAKNLHESDDCFIRVSTNAYFLKTNRYSWAINRKLYLTLLVFQ